MTSERALTIEVPALVREHLRSGFFRCEVLGGKPGHMVTARVSSQMDRHRIKIAAGDEVRLTISPYDLAKGRITYRYKSSKVSA
jgi:translation initiation factor IF-1